MKLKKILIVLLSGFLMIGCSDSSKGLDSIKNIVDSKEDAKTSKNSGEGSNSSSNSSSKSETSKQNNNTESSDANNSQETTTTIQTDNEAVNAYVNYNTGIVTFGKWEQDNNLDNGTEAIEWLKVETSDKILLISKYVLSAVHGEVHGDNYNWSTSKVREWLNGEFYESAFSDSEKKKIVSNQSYSSASDITVKDSYGTSEYAGTIVSQSACEDNVFILSVNGVNGNLDDFEKTAVLTPYCQRESVFALESMYTADYVDPNADSYTYQIGSYATRDYAKFKSVGEKTILWDSTVNSYIYSPGGAPFVGLGIRPCIWIKK